MGISQQVVKITHILIEKIVAGWVELHHLKLETVLQLVGEVSDDIIFEQLGVRDPPLAKIRE